MIRKTRASSKPSGERGIALNSGKSEKTPKIALRHSRIGLRLLLLPVVVSISYEINRWVGRHDNLCSRILSAPGKWLQRLTTNEPDDSMIECAIRALELVIPEQKGSDAW